jgi:hypothetical protein
MLSKEAALVAEYWEATEDVLATQQKLRAEMADFLKSLEQELRREKWWNENWFFGIPEAQQEQVYIAHSKWRAKSGFVLWIGVEQFNPKVVFGKESVPALYLWVDGNASLTEELRSMVSEKKLALPGELTKKPQGYVVRQFIPKCLPPNVKKFDEFMQTPILKFFSACAAQEKLLSKVVARNVRNA